jgi:hypothetical protein
VPTRSGSLPRPWRGTRCGALAEAEEAMTAGAPAEW